MGGQRSRTVTATAGSHTIAAPLVLASGAAFAPASGTQLTISGAISGSGGLSLVAPGTLLLTNTNRYSGGTTLGAGTLALGPAGTLGSGNVTVTAGAVLDVSRCGDAGYSFTGGTLAAGRTGTLATDINGTLNISGATLSPLGLSGSGTLTVSGVLALNNAAIACLPGDLIATGGLASVGTDRIVCGAANGVLPAGAYTLPLFSFPAGSFAPSSIANLSLQATLSNRGTAALDASSGTAVCINVTSAGPNSLTWTRAGGAARACGITRSTRTGTTTRARKATASSPPTTSRSTMPGVPAV